MKFAIYTKSDLVIAQFLMEEDAITFCKYLCGKGFGEYRIVPLI